ncbi:hypothetical protein F4Y93_15075, partial [Candidatus Poribacteria bacterium]|nr:hypothetical protein [Candidatus Poribacteria bacterium]
VVTVDETFGQAYPPGICFSLGTVSGGQYNKHVLSRKWVAASEWFSIDSTWEDASGPFLIETYRVEVHPQQNEVQIVDIKISLRAPKRSIELTGSVGLGYHAVEMEHRKAVDADTRMGKLEMSGKMSAWGTLSGLTTAENAPVGVAILPHPANGKTTFFAEDVAFGYLFAQATPLVVSTLMMRPLKYRILVYAGDLFTVDVSEYYKDYTDIAE